MGWSMKSRKELTEVTATRYRGENRKRKVQILDEFTESTSYNRAYAVLLKMLMQIQCKNGILII
ncbi:MAG: hypothetical protein AB1798_16830 [Spirochaetota bacterium]